MCQRLNILSFSHVKMFFISSLEDLQYVSGIFVKVRRGGSKDWKNGQRMLPVHYKVCLEKEMNFFKKEGEVKACQEGSLGGN